MNPVSLLLDRLNAESFLKFPMLAGIDPSKLLPNALSTDRPVRFPMEDGMTPLSKLVVRSSISRPAKLPISNGMAPDILLLVIRSHWRLVEKLANELGRFPPNLFNPMVSLLNLLQFVKEVINPHSRSLFAWNLLLSSISTSRFCNLPNSVGTTPVKLLL